MKYTDDNAMDEVLKAAPGFRQRWEEHLDYWEGEPAGLVLDMIELAAYTTSLLESTSELKRVFALMEEMLGEGSEEVKNAVATGFLESTVNPVTEETAYLPILVDLLGERSTEFCKAWLKFAGGELPGL